MRAPVDSSGLDSSGPGEPGPGALWTWSTLDLEHFGPGELEFGELALTALVRVTWPWTA